MESAEKDKKNKIIDSSRIKPEIFLYTEFEKFTKEKMAEYLFYLSEGNKASLISSPKFVAELNLTLCADKHNRLLIFDDYEKRKFVRQADNRLGKARKRTLLKHLDVIDQFKEADDNFEKILNEFIELYIKYSGNDNGIKEQIKREIKSLRTIPVYKDTIERMCSSGELEYILKKYIKDHEVTIVKNLLTAN